jgi:hypothetical protein
MPPDSALARDTDPHTSSAAAAAAVAEGKVDGHEWRILEALKWLGRRGGTATEIAADVRERYHIEREILFCAHTVCRRLGALWTRNQIFRRPDPATGAPIARNGEIVYWLHPGDMPLYGE